MRRVTDFQSISWSPYYHPSGEYVIFTSNKFGFSNFELFIVDTDGNVSLSASLSRTGLMACRFSRRTDACSVGRPDAARTAARKSFSPTGTMRRLRTHLPEPHYDKPPIAKLHELQPTRARVHRPGCIARAAFCPRTCHHVYYDLGRRPAPHGGVFGFRRIGRSHDGECRVSAGGRLSRRSIAKSWSSARRQ